MTEGSRTGLLPRVDRSVFLWAREPMLYKSLTRYADSRKDFHAARRTAGRRGPGRLPLNGPPLPPEAYNLEFAPYTTPGEPVDPIQVTRRADQVRLTWDRYS